MIPILAVCILGCSTKMECVRASRIIDIGGCDFRWNCDVVLENGDSVTAEYPILGASVCVQWRGSPL